MIKIDNKKIDTHSGGFVLEYFDSETIFVTVLHKCNIPQGKLFILLKFEFLFSRRLIEGSGKVPSV